MHHFNNATFLCHMMLDVQWFCDWKALGYLDNARCLVCYVMTNETVKLKRPLDVTVTKGVKSFKLVPSLM